MQKMVMFFSCLLLFPLLAEAGTIELPIVKPGDSWTYRSTIIMNREKKNGKNKAWSIWLRNIANGHVIRDTGAKSGIIYDQFTSILNQRFDETLGTLTRKLKQNSREPAVFSINRYSRLPVNRS